ncbi:MAG: general secretion pathway protein GspB [Pseudomonadales bacterium]
MSYILDAVRKAEEERQQSKNPGVRNLGTVGISPNKLSNRRYWVGGALALIIANAAAWYALSQDAESDTVASKSVATEEAVVKRASSLDSAETISTVQVEPTQAVFDTTSQSPQQVKLWQAPVDAQTAIGGLEFSFHVYSTDSQRRTIIINKQRMREGERISDSMTLNRITESGVLLAYNNLLVEVEILEQW